VAVDDEFSVRIPSVPAVWSAAEELVAVTVHAAGSAEPAFQTFARIVVGLAPSAWTRRT
jgi:hypothetical protein